VIGDGQQVGLADLRILMPIPGKSEIGGRPPFRNSGPRPRGPDYPATILKR